MSLLRNKSDEVVKKGVLDRGEFNPPADSFHLKMYKYWERNTGARIPKTENFCHYWRVVALWSPLTFIREKFLDAIVVSTTWLILTALYVLGAIALGVFSSFWFPVIMLGVPYILAGIVSGGVSYTTGEGFGNLDEDDTVDKRAFKLATFITAPISLALYGILNFFEFVGDKADDMSNKTKKRLDDVFKIFIGLIIVGLISILAIAGVSDFGWIFFAYAAGAIVALLAFVVGASFLIAKIEAIGNAKREAKRERREKYINGEITAEEYFGNSWEPGKIYNFFDRFLFTPAAKVLTPVGDFLVLAWNVVRVKKWKICPIVNIPAERVSE